MQTNRSLYKSIKYQSLFEGFLPFILFPMFVRPRICFMLSLITMAEILFSLTKMEDYSKEVREAGLELSRN